jgi:ubiquinone/menaquinone biosynthesis C-methylase UbiE
MSERTYDDFDEFAENYREIHNENLKFSGADSQYFAEMKIKLLKNKETNVQQRVLDIGCGDGLTEVYFAQYFSAWQIDGIDVSEESITVAKQRKLPNANFQTYDSIHFPFENNSFDKVFIANVLHHVAFNKHADIFNEIFRVLKKNGKILIYEHNPLNPLTQYLVKTCIFDKDAKLLSHFYTLSMLKKHHLFIEKMQFIVFFPRKGILSKLIFLEKYLQWLPIGGQYYCSAIKKDC